MDLISREALIKLFASLKDEHETNAISYNALYKVILQQPTIEAVPVVHGEWIEVHKHKWKLDENGDIDTFAWFSGYCNGVRCEICGAVYCIHCHPDWEEKVCEEASYECSVCGNHVMDKTSFCSSCGADMRKKV